MLAATYLIYMAKFRFHRVVYGIFKGFSRAGKSSGVIFWSLDKLSMDKRNMASFQQD